MCFFPRGTLVAALTGGLLLAGAGAVGAAPAPAPSEGPGRPSLAGSWTARILFPVVARRAPGGRVVMRLRHFSPYSEGPSSFMVTESRVIGRKTWIRIQLPKRPNGTQGWVPESAVELRPISTWIRIAIRARTVTVFQRGKRVKRFAAAVGTGGTPTPRGLFAIWDPVRVDGQLGPYVLVLTAYSNALRTFAGGDGVVGIHGWPDRGVLGKAVSHGCVRMSRDEVRALARYAQPGVPVEIVA